MSVYKTEGLIASTASKPTSCRKYVSGGSWYCDKCGTNWDLDEVKPPCIDEDLAE